MKLIPGQTLAGTTVLLGVVRVEQKRLGERILLAARLPIVLDCFQPGIATAEGADQL